MSNRPYTIIEATAQDGPALAEIRVLAMRESLEAAGRFDPDRARLRFLAGFTPEHTHILYRDGICVGFYVLRDHQTYLYLDHLYLHPAQQGTGIGSAVVSFLQQVALARGLPIRLLALRGSRANQFYCDHGFIPIAEEDFDTRYEWLPR